jgi:hypothetical protein
MKLSPIAEKRKEKLVGYAKLERAPDYVTGYREIAGRFVPAVSTALSARDRRGDIAVRWSLGRDDYKVEPGLYAIGEPTPSSPVLVSANYKLTFDKLRKELGGIDAWLAILDTKGVNVWCAAGKGTFGTAELLDKISRLRLGDIVSHNLLVLPQLGASGVSAPEIARLSRFKVAWGPVRAADIPAFLAAGMKKTEAMREVRFDLADRMAVAPVELAHAWPFALAAAALSLLGALPLGPGPSFGARLAWLLVSSLGSLGVGAIAFPALLPYLPSKAFSIKGAVLGTLWGLACALFGVAVGLGPALGAAILLVCAPVVAYVALNFTGSSTYTCQSGANLEVEKSVVPIIASIALGLGLGTAARVFGL